MTINPSEAKSIRENYCQLHLVAIIKAANAPNVTTRPTGRYKSSLGGGCLALVQRSVIQSPEKR